MPCCASSRASPPEALRPHGLYDRHWARAHLASATGSPLALAPQPGRSTSGRRVRVLAGWLQMRVPAPRPMRWASGPVSVTSPIATGGTVRELDGVALLLAARTLHLCDSPLATRHFPARRGGLQHSAAEDAYEAIRSRSPSVLDSIGFLRGLSLGGLLARPSGSRATSRVAPPGAFGMSRSGGVCMIAGPRARPPPAA